MQYKRLSSSDLEVSRIAFGCWGLTADNHWGPRDESESLGAIDAALDAGINFFDTAEMYANGASESLLGKSMEGRRDQFIVATKMKFDSMSNTELISSCEAALKRLRTDVIDLYQIHWPHPEVPLEETWGAMQQLRDQGKVRHIGVCNFGSQHLSEVCEIEAPLTDQLPYNLIWRAIESEILPACRSSSIDTLIYSPLMHGMLADKYASSADVPDGRARSRHFSSQREQTRHGEEGHEQLSFETLDQIRDIAVSYQLSMAQASLIWLLSKQDVGCIIMGAKNAKQVAQNVAIFDHYHRLGSQMDGLIEELDKATEPLATALGANPDMWQGSQNSRFR